MYCAHQEATCMRREKLLTAEVSAGGQEAGAPHLRRGGEDELLALIRQAAPRGQLARQALADVADGKHGERCWLGLRLRLRQRLGLRLQLLSCVILCSRLQTLCSISRNLAAVNSRASAGSCWYNTHKTKAL